MTDLIDSTGGVGRPDDGVLAVWPFYIVCDESGSMSGEPIQAVNTGIIDLLQMIVDDPVVDQKARFSIIAFNDNAQVVLPLTELSKVTDVPQCVPSGSTSYSAAFRLVKQQIETDVPVLRGAGLKVHRPTVYFISDGAPNAENWQAEHAALIDPGFSYRPNIMSFGVAGAQQDVILSLATTPSGMEKPLAFQGKDGVSPGNALKEIMRFIVGTIVASAKQGQGADAAVDMSKPPTGTEFIIDVLGD